MHIIIAILTALIGAFVAFRYFVDAADKGREAVTDARNVIRSNRWSRKVDQRLIHNLSDPREAAAVLLYQIAAYDGAVTDNQRIKITSVMQDAFSVDHEISDGLFAFARMAVGEINDAANSLKKILRPVSEHCTDAEKNSVIEMLTEVAAVEGEITDMQMRLLNETKHLLLPSH